ncbi:hypothetical protein [Nocardia wallacei]|uniref:hypothetical protein n=1 Tax=Nocardia wallacei TaxID=480035 RepID=UPI0024572C5B|nr:hypothetical protein [Nocardia wallacei]
MTAAVEEPLAWGVAANITQAGTKHFVPGAKVWVSLPQWGDGGERLTVVGHHRGRGHRLVKLIINSKHLENFRAKGIYSPAEHRLLTESWPGRACESREEAEQSAAAWNARLREEER